LGCASSPHDYIAMPLIAILSKIGARMKIPPVLLIVIALLLSACATTPSADFDIRGEWEYTMTSTDGNTYDTGTITFDGEAAMGTYLEINIYQVEYTGEFSVNGTALKLTGDETWEGTLTDANALSGTWSHSDGVSGTFTATRR
jgi:hypothetical protein